MDIISQVKSYAKTGLETAKSVYSDERTQAAIASGKTMGGKAVEIAKDSFQKAKDVDYQGHYKTARNFTVSTVSAGMEKARAFSNDERVQSVYSQGKELAFRGVEFAKEIPVRKYANTVAAKSATVAQYTYSTAKEYLSSFKSV